MRAAVQVAQELQDRTAELCFVQGQALGAIEQLQNRVKEQYQESAKHIDVQYKAKRQQLEAKNKRAAAIAKRQVVEATEKLLAQKEDERLRTAEYLQLGEIYYRDGVASTAPLIVPFIGHGNICLDLKDAAASIDSSGIMRSVLSRAIERTAPMQLQIASYDPLLRNMEAPFVSIGAQDSTVVRYYQSQNSIDQLLDELTAQINRVSNTRLEGHSTIVQYHQSIGTTVEPYILVVLHDYPNSISKAQHKRIQLLLRSCCPAGICFLLDVTSGVLESGEAIAEDFAADCQRFVWEGCNVRWIGHPNWSVRLYETSSQEARSVAQQAKNRLQKLTLPTLSIEDTFPDAIWGQSSIDGITFTLGIDGNEKVEVTLGSKRQQLHNALITGAVGQGKSNLIKAIVYDLCARYSPDELELYLLDFKEGVTLYQMAPTEGSPECLPQACVLGLEADEDFGISVLEELFRIGARRAQTIKPYGDNIFKYRTQCPSAVMPRILLVIDEFQLFLESGRGAYAAELLVRAARKLRSYGIHIILASQSMGGISSLLTKSDTFYAQFPVRVGLKNSPSESRATFGPLNEAAAHLRFFGQAVLNTNYGEVGANRIIQTPDASDEAINRMRDRLYHLREGAGKTVSVFDGTVLPRYEGAGSGDIPFGDKGVPSLLLGKEPSVAQWPARFPLDQMPGRNLAIVGNGEDTSNPDLPNLGYSLIASAVRSLANDDEAKKGRIVVLNCLTTNSALADVLESLHEEVGQRIGSFMVLDAPASRDWLSDYACSRLSDSECEKQYVFGIGMDRLGTFDMTFQNQLFRRIKDAPIEGTHFIFWWISYAALNGQLGLSGISAFDGVALMFGTASIAKQVEGPLSVWNGHSLRVLYKDSTSGRPAERIIPFSLGV